MIPKEKAKELVEKYYKKVYPVKAFSSTGLYEAKEKAVKAALICVDEVLLILYHNSAINGYRINYWQEVKQEIEKL